MPPIVKISQVRPLVYLFTTSCTSERVSPGNLRHSICISGLLPHRRFTPTQAVYSHTTAAL